MHCGEKSGHGGQPKPLLGDTVGGGQSLVWNSELRGSAVNRTAVLPARQKGCASESGRE